MILPPYASAEQGRVDTAEMLRAPSRLKVVEAIKKSMRVPKGAANSEAWDDTLTGYMNEPINCLASRQYDAVIFVGPARTGKTIGLIDGFICYVIYCDPADTLLVQLTEEKAREHSKKRLDRTFRASPLIAQRMSPIRHDNNVHDKIFKSGMYLKIGWPSINVLSSSDYRNVLLTDYDRWPLDIDGEGDGYSLASKRTTTFMSAGMTAVESSPGHDVIDPRWRPPSANSHEAPPCEGIIKLYNQGDRRRLYWPCPDCGEHFQPVQENMQWPDDKAEPDPVRASEAARVVCPHCSRVIEPHEKRALNHPDTCVWLREGETIDRHGTRAGEPRQSRIASFWMEGPAAAYQTWAKLVYQLILAEQEFELTGSQETLKARINTDWGRPYLHRNGQQDFAAEDLLERAEPFTKRTVPHGVRFLIGSVDVQGGRKRRFVVQIIGYGENGERWLVDRYNLREVVDTESGEISPIDPAGRLEHWDILETDVMDKRYRLSDGSGRRMPVLAIACDHGGEAGVSDNAYRFWRKMRRKGRGTQFYLVKGEGKAQQLIRKSFPDNTDNSRRRASARGDVPLYLLDTDRIKDKIDTALHRDEPGPNYLHHPDWLGLWFFQELTAETRGPDGKWRKVSEKAANEALDLYGYAHAVAIVRGYERINWQAPPPWAKDWDDNPNILQPDQPAKVYREPDPQTVSEPAAQPKPEDTAPADNWLGSANNDGWLS
ncbi:phage terminase large subunit family protein [Ferrimonas pelagia]|uniref:Phage terminase large subunit family protein n=1 Tax=Ferrimonas pelagia TaxID=1177826 RepID=A0ABP9EL03_9GAMM